MKASGVVRMGQTRRGSSEFAVEVGRQLGNLRTVAAADYTGSDTRWGIAGKVAGNLLEAAVRKDRMAEMASRWVVGRVAW